MTWDGLKLPTFNLPITPTNLLLVDPILPEHNLTELKADV